jgi:5-(carboxyamino)imidazole ribonucleotide mutase
VKLKKKNNKVAIIMGSQSDYSIMKDCKKILKILKIKHKVLIVSAHRTPKRMFKFAETAEKNGFGVIVAGAGGSAHLAGMVASLTTLPVLGVPIESKKLKGLDSLLSMVQMPSGVPIGCLAIDGAFNAGLLAASIIGNFDEKIKTNIEKWRRLQTQSVKKKLNNKCLTSL